jgi:hypothetical protein
MIGYYFHQNRPVPVLLSVVQSEIMLIRILLGVWLDWAAVLVILFILVWARSFGKVAMILLVRVRVSVRGLCMYLQHKIIFSFKVDAEY